MRQKINNILTKHKILNILLDVDYNYEKIKEIKDILDLYEKEKGIPDLGYTIHAVKCQECGCIHGSVHPIPMIFPCECNKCGKMSCWIYEGDKCQDVV